MTAHRLLWCAATTAAAAAPLPVWTVGLTGRPRRVQPWCVPGGGVLYFTLKESHLELPGLLRPLFGATDEETERRAAAEAAAQEAATAAQAATAAAAVAAAAASPPKKLEGRGKKKKARRR